METELIDNATHWLTNNQTLLIEYGVNIAAALLTLVIGWLAANLLTGGMVRLMKARNLDSTITDFIGNLVKYAILAFVLIAALSRIGVQTASFVAVIGAGWIYHQLSGGTSALASMGIVAFSGMAQVLPAMIAGLLWRGATRRGLWVSSASSPAEPKPTITYAAISPEQMKAHT